MRCLFDQLCSLFNVPLTHGILGWTVITVGQTMTDPVLCFCIPGKIVVDWLMPTGFMAPFTQVIKIPNSMCKFRHAFVTAFTSISKHYMTFKSNCNLLCICVINILFYLSLLIPGRCYRLNSNPSFFLLHNFFLSSKLVKNKMKQLCNYGCIVTVAGLGVCEAIREIMTIVPLSIQTYTGPLNTT